MGEFRIRIEEPRLLSEDIAKVIRSAIIRGKYQPGEKIPEGDLASSMGISRTPIREAFRKLESEGFVRIIPRKGAVVAGMDPKEIENLYQIKSTLEGLAARLACSRMKGKDVTRLKTINMELKKLMEGKDVEGFYRAHTRFHEVFVNLSGNPKLIQMISNLNDHFKRFGTVSLALPGQFEEAIRQHARIVEAFSTGDEDDAEARVRDNVMTGGRVLIDHIGKGSGKAG